MKACKGVIATGHPATTEAARVILEAGGNAFDAVLAAHFAACVSEPVLASLGGGGFLMSHSKKHGNNLYDFFCQTPIEKKALNAVDFHPIIADFGTATQEFHIGMGSVATPGTVKGLFAIHNDLGSMPMSRIVEPATELARQGITVNGFQAYILEIVNAIYHQDSKTLAVFESSTNPGQLLTEGELLRLPEYAEILESLASEGAGLFYQGELAKKLIAHCDAYGGFLTQQDLSSYEVIRRKPLEVEFSGARILTNPPPSCGGILIALALELLSGAPIAGANYDDLGNLELLVRVMEQTNKARVESGLDRMSDPDQPLGLLDADFILKYRDQVLGRPVFSRGTTQFSVIDSLGNIASMTVSNGEGCGHILPGTGIMLNNMLGEEDLHPAGFHQWQTDQRIASMMSPSIVLESNGSACAIGSGGSNRIRTAILQVLCNLLRFDMPLGDAVQASRIHFEDDHLNIEDGINPKTLDALVANFPSHHHWPDKNLFFGGVHAVRHSHGSGLFEGIGDPRRGGDSTLVS